MVDPPRSICVGFTVAVGYNDPVFRYGPGCGNRDLLTAQFRTRPLRVHLDPHRVPALDIDLKFQRSDVTFRERNRHVKRHPNTRSRPVRRLNKPSAGKHDHRHADTCG